MKYFQQGAAINYEHDIETGSQHPRKVTQWGGPSAETENRSPESQQVWLDKDPSLLKDPERQA